MIGRKAYERVHFTEGRGSDVPLCEERSSALKMVYKWPKVTCLNCRAERPK